MKNAGKLSLLLLALLAFACKKPFTPDVVANSPNYLVVEGVINTGADSTTIKLSRTTKLNDTTKTLAEPGATLYVEDDQNGHYNLTAVGNGVYKCAPLNLTSAKKCRLHIATQDRKEYVSDFVDNLNTPAIDSIAYTIVGSGIQFYTYTHDATNQIKYFRWDFDETWKYQALYQSLYKYDAVNNKVIPRAGENIFNCWITGHSNQILLGSTQNLSQAVVNALPLTYVDVLSGKLALGYSMLLHQYALSKEAYEYWQKLKKNTEQLGSIFDAQPSDLRGNIHNTGDANEPVLGYISASVVTTKRFLIGHNAVPLYSQNYFAPPSVASCTSKAVDFAPLNTYDDRLRKALSSGDSTLVSDDGINGVLYGYTYAPSECVDCRKKILGGTNVKPPYWPDGL